MKKAIIFFAFALLSVYSFGQAIHKGNLLGFHVYTTKLKDGATMNDFVKFFTTKAIPDIEKSFPGMKVYLMKSLRGQDSSSLGTIYLFNNEAGRNKYFNEDGTATATGNAAYAKLTAMFAELDKYATFDDELNKYADWLIE